MLKTWKIIIPILILLIGFVLWKTTRQKVDDDWTMLNNLDLSKVESLKDNENKLQDLFENFHEQEFEDKNLAIELIGDPYVPTMEYSQFEKYVAILNKEKRIIISTVSGGGVTTFIDRLSKFVAIDESRILSIRCAPKFDIAYHKEYIGNESDGVFVKGKLLQFWDLCKQNPRKKFICIFDDIDKINPETFYGAELWENLSSLDKTTVLGNDSITIPDNYYQINTTQSAVGERIHLHNEHFKRLGRDIYLKPSTMSLAMFLEEKREKLERKVNKKGIESLSDTKRQQLEALQDTDNITKFLYIFLKVNQIIEKDISRNNQLGQWSNLRKLFLPKDREKFIETFIHQVNAISPQKKFDRSNFDPIFYSINNNGLMKGSSPIAKGFTVFKEWGFLTEFVVALCFALITALVSIYMTSKRKRKIAQFLTKSEEIFINFEQREMGTESTIVQLNKLKEEIEYETKANNISFAEAIFFHNSIRSKVNAIEISKNINSTFLMLMDVFMDDGVLSKSEYDKLITFLRKIEYSIPKKEFQEMLGKVERTWKECGE